MRRKYKYFRQLATTVMVALFVPVIICFSYFWKTSTDKMDKENQSYYEKQTEVFMSHFNEAVVELRKQSITISVGSKNKDSGFYKGSEDFSENAYGLYEVMMELRELYSSWGRNKSVECGIYYYDIDRVVTWEGSRSADHFIRYMANTERDCSLTEFFRQENYEPSKMMFGTTNTGEKADGSMLVGYCTTMGRKLNQVLIFYVISEDMFLDFLRMAYSGGGNDYCIMDKETGQIYLALYLSESPEKSADFWWEKANLYRSGKSMLPLDFVVRIAEDSLQNNILVFRNTMYKLLIFTILALMVVCAGILYINYMPIYKLVKDIGHGEEDEITAVRMALDSRHSKMKEQEMLILDLLMEHLLRGIPIPKERVRHFGIVSKMNYYQVYILEGGVLLSADAERLTKEMENALAVRMFVTDWQEDGRAKMKGRMFKKQVGVGFVEYVNYKRMEYAKELLLTTDDPVKTVALMCGFSNDNYFSKYFKSVVGVSPSSFREL